MKHCLSICLVAAFTFIPLLTTCNDQSKQSSKNPATQKYAKDLSGFQNLAIKEGFGVCATVGASIFPYSYIGFLTCTKELTPSTLRTVFKKSVTFSAVTSAALGAIYTYDRIDTWKDWHHKPE